MADENPGEKAVFILCEWAAGACIFAVVEKLAAGKSFHTIIPYVISAIFFATLGVKWPALKAWSGFSGFSSGLEKLATNYRFRTSAVITVVVIFSSLASAYLRSIRHDLDVYVMPREVTAGQAQDLREYLSRHESHSVSVRVNQEDAEASYYAGQLQAALASWDVSLDTDNVPPIVGVGLCIMESGEAAKPTIPAKNDPLVLLREAFRVAHIEASCDGGSASGAYKVFVEVRHRPLMVGDNERILHRLGNWLRSK